MLTSWKQSNQCYQDTRDLRGQWWHWNHWSYLVDFPRCHDQCRRHHDRVAGNPHQHAALLALLPKDCTNAWKSITRQYTDFSSRQIQVTLWFQDGDFSRYLGTGLVRPNSIKFHCVAAATFTYPIQQGIDQLVTCCWWIQFPLSSLSHVSAVQEQCSHVFEQQK